MSHQHAVRMSSGVDALEFRNTALEVLARCVGGLPCLNAPRRQRTFQCGAQGVNGCFHVAENLMRLVGPLFVALVWVLIGGIVVSWYMVLAPFLWGTRGWALVGHALFAHWLLLNICFHYYKGWVFLWWTSADMFGSRRNHDAARQPTSGLGGWKMGCHIVMTCFTQLDPEVYRLGVQHNYRHCVKCKNLKPEKAHHCHVCQKCVLDMDHHCPWLNNCVGHGNQRFFFLFMLFMWFGCVYVAAVASAPFFEFRQRHARSVVAPIDATEEMQLTFCFVLTSAVVVALGVLLGWHAYLVSTGCTTIVFFETKTACAEAREKGEKYRNPYDLGFRKNWRLFLGLRADMSVLRMLLPSTHAAVGDGLHWSHAKLAPDVEVV